MNGGEDRRRPVEAARNAMAARNRIEAAQAVQDALDLNRLQLIDMRNAIRDGAVRACIARAEREEREGERLSRLKAAKNALRRFASRAPMEPKRNGQAEGGEAADE
jgi:hypothetical protein